MSRAGRCSLDRVFVKLGGSFITRKSEADSLKESSVTLAARMLRKALEARPVSLVLGHGAGSYGHILAMKYGAVQGVHRRHGWEALYRIRESMTSMNLRFVRCCGKGGLHPVTVSPFAVALARGGKVRRLDVGNIRELLRRGQIPLLHGDVVPDTERGFTIASTEALLTALTGHMRFDRVVMVSDTEGVLDGEGRTIERIDGRNFGAVRRFLKGSGSPDVTGGMRKKVEHLFRLVSSGRVSEARIIRCEGRPRNLADAVLGTGGGGTLIRK